MLMPFTSKLPPTRMDIEHATERASFIRSAGGYPASGDEIRSVTLKITYLIAVVTGTAAWLWMLIDFAVWTIGF